MSPLTRQRDEALQRLTATSEVLQIIKTSPANWGQCFGPCWEKATDLSGSKFGNLYLYNRGSLIAATYHSPPALVASACGLPCVLRQIPA